MSKPIAGSEGESTPDTSGVTPEDSSQTVSYASYKKLLDQKKAQDDKLREQNARIAQVESDEAAKREEILRAEKRHDEIIANQKAEIERLSGSLGQVKSEIANSMKRQSVERELGGFARPEYAQFIKLEDVVLDETGLVDATSVAREAARLRSEHPTLLKPTPQAVKSGAPRTAFDTQTPTTSDVSWEAAIADHFKDK